MFARELTRPEVGRLAARARPTSADVRDLLLRTQSEDGEAKLAALAASAARSARSRTASEIMVMREMAGRRATYGRAAAT